MPLSGMVNMNLLLSVVIVFSLILESGTVSDKDFQILLGMYTVQWRNQTKTPRQNKLTENFDICFCSAQRKVWKFKASIRWNYILDKNDHCSVVVWSIR